jgi:ferredoxin
VEAMILISANDPHKINRKVAKVAEELCLGCGVCVRSCNKDSLSLKSRPDRVITPSTGVHRTVMMALERGNLQHLIFDNRALWSHRAMAAILGAVLKMPPVKQVLANNQLKSRYVDALISKSRN